MERFAASYLAHDPHLDHDLVVLCKAGADPAFRQACREVAARLHARCLDLPDRGRDLDAYRAAAARLDARVLCFLNSSSEILSPGWLARLREAVAAEGVGIAGATGSWESALSSAPRPLRPLLRSEYPPFPNPHLRTNAFLLRRELMLSLQWPPTRRKRRGLALESGRRSITRQVWERGMETVVVGADGRAYTPRQWPDSRTFRSGDQENLLVADNRTRQYAEAGEPARASLGRMAWGEPQADGAGRAAAPEAARSSERSVSSAVRSQENSRARS